VVVSSDSVFLKTPKEKKVTTKVAKVAKFAVSDGTLKKHKSEQTVICHTLPRSSFSFEDFGLEVDNAFLQAEAILALKHQHLDELDRMSKFCGDDVKLGCVIFYKWFTYT